MNDALGEIIDTGVVAVLRARSSVELMDAARALYQGGVRAIEVTMTTPNALEVIKEVSKEMSGDVFVGVGSVLDGETARAAILAGAEFVVGPVLNEGVVKVCKRYSKVVCPGAFTPTEIFRAWELGADIVKVFPATVVGPRYFKDILAPLPQVRLMPTGGVSVENAADFIRAGACAVAAGSSLVDKKAVAERRWDIITETAKRMIVEVKRGREG